MTDYETISQIAKKTGVSYEKAKDAYEACGKDSLAASIMLENDKMNYETVGDDMITVYDRNGRRHNSGASSDFSNGLKKFLNIFTNNKFIVSGSREYFSMPLFAAALLLILLWEVALPAAVISLFFGIKYTLTGPDFEKDFVVAIERNNN